MSAGSASSELKKVYCEISTEMQPILQLDLDVRF